MLNRIRGRPLVLLTKNQSQIGATFHYPPIILETNINSHAFLELILSLAPSGLSSLEPLFLLLIQLMQPQLSTH